MTEPTAILKVQETPLTDRITNLCKGQHSFELRCTPLRGGGHDEEVPFVVFFEVLGVKDWGVFYSKGYEAAEEEVRDVEDLLREQLISILGTVPKDYLQYRTKENMVVISEKVFVPAVEMIKEVFGLEVRLLTVRRTLTGSEKALQEVNASYLGQYQDAEIKGLRTKLGHRGCRRVRASRRQALGKTAVRHRPRSSRDSASPAADQEAGTRDHPESARLRTYRLVTDGGGESLNQVAWEAYENHLLRPALGPASPAEGLGPRR